MTLVIDAITAVDSEYCRESNVNMIAWCDGCERLSILWREEALPDIGNRESNQRRLRPARGQAIKAFENNHGSKIATHLRRQNGRASRQVTTQFSRNRKQALFAEQSSGLRMITTEEAIRGANRGAVRNQEAPRPGLWAAIL
jgi:hypothetical protein